MSRTLSKTECNYPTVEKEATSIIEAVRKWGHFLYGKPFTLITDQRSLAFMFDKSCRGKIKNAKIQAWRAELGTYTYHVQYRPGSENAASDALSRVCGAIGCPGDLPGLHESLGHPGITRFWHFIRSENLPFSIEEVRQTCVQYTTCSALKPRFYQPPRNKLIRATQAWERIIIDFKGPLTTSHRGNKYLLIVVDEYSRFPFAFACKDTSALSVTNCLALLFSLVGFPYVHSDRGTAFMSKAVKDYLHSRGLAASHSTPYHPTGNSQCERCNQTVWKTVSLILKGRNLSPHLWELILPDVLHAVRTLLCTATSASPHEKFFPFSRRSMLCRSLSSWMTFFSRTVPGLLELSC